MARSSAARAGFSPHHRAIRAAEIRALEVEQGLATPLRIRYGMSEIEARLRALNIELPPPPKPAANYVSAVASGNLLFLSGQGPRNSDGAYLTGKVPTEVSPEAAYDGARRVGLGLLATARAELGSLDRVRRVVKLLGMVNAAPDFGGHPAVINGCSDLLVEVFGDAGRHARSAVGMASLPVGISVEIEAIFEIEPPART